MSCKFRPSRIKKTRMTQTNCVIRVLIFEKNCGYKFYFPNEIKLANNRYAPGTPAGSSRKNDKPV